MLFVSYLLTVFCPCAFVRIDFKMICNTGLGTRNIQGQYAFAVFPTMAFFLAEVRGLLPLCPPHNANALSPEGRWHWYPYLPILCVHASVEPCVCPAIIGSRLRVLHFIDEDKQNLLAVALRLHIMAGLVHDRQDHGDQCN